jgi:hypothetical protein
LLYPTKNSTDGSVTAICCVIFQAEARQNRIMMETDCTESSNAECMIWHMQWNTHSSSIPV